MLSTARSCARFAVIALASFLALVVGIENPAFANDEKPPNVIIFLAHDLGWADVGYHSEEVI